MGDWDAQLHTQNEPNKQRRSLPIIDTLALTARVTSHHCEELFMQSISEESTENGLAPPQHFFEVMPLIVAVTRPRGME